MVLLFGEAHQNAAAAVRLYQARFPNRRLPNGRTFSRTVQRLRDTGKLAPQVGIGGGNLRHAGNVDEEIIELVEDDPTISIRTISHNLNVPQTVVWRTIKENQYHPFHFQRVQDLLPQDYAARVIFCQWLIGKHDENPNFTRNVLVTDEACFNRTGVLNFHNLHLWAQDNPHAIRRHFYQHQFSVNVWAGIVDDQLIGPFILPNRLNGDGYLQFLQEDLPGLLENVVLAVRRDMWYLHDGAPPHFRNDVREYLTATYHHRWVGRGGPVAWPPRSPDLNPLDFYLWGHFKSLVYHTEVQNHQDLLQRIENAADLIRRENRHETFTKMRENWVRRARLCVQIRGRHIEQNTI